MERDSSGLRQGCALILLTTCGVANEEGLDGVKVIRTPRSFASLFSMGDFLGGVDEAIVNT